MKCKTSPIAGKNSPCSGKYGKSLNIKLIDTCNADCAFCVEKFGKESDEQIATEQLITTINNSDANNVMLLGGEPTLYKNLKSLISGIIGKNVYLTTNGIKLNEDFVLTNELWQLNGINISIHSYDEKENGSILKTRNYPRFETLKKAIDTIHTFNPMCNIRINSVLTKGMLDNIDAIFKMTELAKYLGVNQIKFSEIQGEDYGMFVYAKDVFKDIFEIAEEAFSGGCEDFHEMDGVSIIVRQACGYASQHKPFPGGRHQYNDYSVLYPDGELSLGWKSAEANRCGGCRVSEKSTEIVGCGSYSCRPAPNRYSCYGNPIPDVYKCRSVPSRCG